MNGRRARMFRKMAVDSANVQRPAGGNPLFYPLGTYRRIYKELKKRYTRKSKYAITKGYALRLPK